MNIICLQCGSDSYLKRSGYYTRQSDKKRIQRYYCRSCKKYFSVQTFSHEYRQKKRKINQPLFRMLSKGCSQRACAFMLGISKETVARRVVRFAEVSQRNLEVYRSTREKVKSVIIDEMESFEHTKCKPITIPITVEEKTRKILSLDAGSIAAKGHLAKIAKKKYGYRKCQRRQVLESVLRQTAECTSEDLVIKSDLSQHYPRPIKKYFAEANHIAFKGKRGCVVGQGELKEGGFDPLFSLNHSFAMIRDNVKRLSRRTWCTTKIIDGLKRMLYIYAWFHNLKLDNSKRVVLRSLGAIA